MLQTSSELYWYIFYTCPRAEKIVKQELLNRNYDVFLPMTKSLKVWKNRQKKWIDQVLFPNYIFVETHASELYRITQIPKIVSCITCSGKPSIISSKEVEGLREMLNSGKDITVERNFIKGDNVKIVRGPSAGYDGILIEQKGKTRFGVRLEGINHAVLIDINIKLLEKV